MTDGLDVAPARAGVEGRERTVVHLLRHGEVHNPDRVLYGRLPGFKLSDLGQQMAQRAADALAGRDVALIVSSPLERAQQTAAPIAEAFGLSIEIDARIVEADNAFEGKRVGVGDGVLREPRYWHLLRNPFKPSWGEPYDELATRMLAAAASARDAARGREAVLVSHQLPIWIARMAAERRRLWHDPRRRECSLASITSFTYVGDELTHVGYAEPSADLLPQAQPGKGA